MLRLILCSITLLILARCGGQCAGDHTGTYTRTGGGTMKLNGACVYEGDEAGCSLKGTYGGPLGSSGTVAVNITSATGDCTTGNLSCEYDRNGNTLVLDCGAGPATYTKQ